MPNAYDTQIAADGATHYWPMQEAASPIVDQIGTSNGTGAGGLTYQQPGPIPGLLAVAFDGIAGTEFNCGNGPFASGMFTGHDCSIEGWGMIDTSRTWPDTEDEAICGGGATTNDQYPNLALRASSTRLAGEPRKAHWAQWGSSVNSSFDTAEGVWYHVVGTYKNTGIVRLIYVNGQDAGDVNVGTAAAMNAPTTAAFFIGSFWGGGYNLKGLLCRVAIYPLVLTPAQIANHYALGLPAAMAGILSSSAGLSGPR